MAIYLKQKKFSIMEIIHIVLGKANPQRMNGVNKVVYQLATNQSAFGRKVQLWGFSKDTTRNFGERNFETKLFKSQTNPFLLDSDFEKQVQASSDNTCFHFHGGWIPTFYAAAKVLKRYNRKYVLTPHGAYNTIAMQKNALVKKMYFHLFEKSVVSNALSVHCIGQSETAGLNRMSKKHSIFLQPYGFENTKLIQQKSGADTFIFGFLGRIDIYTKGLDLMIEAFAKKFYKHSKVKLWIIGDSKEKDSLVQRVKDAGLEEQVVFWGAKFNEEKDELLNAIDIFLHPSRNEGLPTAVLEAASFGKPSIVTNATNVGEYIKEFDAGYCVPNNNALALSEAMQESYELSPQLYQNKSSNAKSMLEETFAWKKVLGEFDKLYTGACAI